MPSHENDNINGTIKDLIINYHELNSNVIDELFEEPSALEFMRYVARNRPFVVRKGAQDWPACRKWNASYLKEVMCGQMVNVAITPLGNADSVVETRGGELQFVKPYETEEPFNEVLEKIQRREHDSENKEPVRYAQTQNDNLRNEYESLFSDVPKSIPFARIALQKEPEAINFWLGNSHSITALHKDPYENIYVQVLGQKHFVLLPPVEAACVNEQVLRAATYVPVDSSEELGYDAHLDDPPATIPFATWDPDDAESRPTAFSTLSRPLQVTLDPGDMLYLPALWYHKVSQSCSDEGICCAVNYWYDMEFSGSFYPLCTFARNVGLAANGQGVNM
ncbi:phospholipase A2 [Tothia fuscella]|uniref:Phospholipase A2 n=1 Tax=Tothia fuscella TaxID=1048955 RepID=A0A9P4NNM8_9PEZI|nr:phospholipase A2 [Tothia fuscella]